MMTSFSYWFWSHLSIVIIVLMVLLVVGYGLLVWFAWEDFKEWKEFFDAEDSSFHNREH